MIYDREVWVTFEVVSICLSVARPRRLTSTFFLDICLYRFRCWCTVNCASDVRILSVMIALTKQGT
jgi:hypothetical protein